MLLTGWMSGAQFRPEPLMERNIFTDSFALAWETKFAKYFVRRFKDEPAIAGWGFGNESNVMSLCPSREAAFVWSSLIANTIRSEDVSRPIISGMHGLAVEGAGNSWHIADQGQVCDVVTTHPYPLFTPYCDMDPLVNIRSTLHATAESCLYSDLSQKPCFIEEMGELGRGVANEQNSRTYLDTVLWSCWSHNHCGCLWWAAFDVPPTDKVPYDWFPFESTLGLFSVDRKSKLTAGAISDFAKMIASLPAEYRALPPHKKQAVCILSHEQEHWPIAFASFILAKQAGYTIRFVSPDDDIPPASFYLLTSLGGYGSLSQTRWNTITKNISDNGGVLYLSVADALLSNLGQIAGVEVVSRQQRRRDLEIRFNSGTTLKCPNNIGAKYQLSVKPHGADIEAIDSDGVPVLTRFKFGKGTVFFLNVGLELLLGHQCGAFDKESPDFASIYRIIGKEVIDRAIVTKNSDARSLLLTEHPCADGSTLVVGVNHGAELLNSSVAYDDRQFVAKALYGNSVSAKGLLQISIETGAGFVTKLTPKQ
jgi:hypothetical protein